MHGSFYLTRVNVTLVESMNDYIVIFVTTKTKDEAEKISQLLIRERLIACANIVSPITSFFRW